VDPAVLETTVTDPTSLAMSVSVEVVTDVLTELAIEVIVELEDSDDLIWVMAELAAVLESE
jgi:hypothetical protein